MGQLKIKIRRRREKEKKEWKMSDDIPKAVGSSSPCKAMSTPFGKVVNHQEEEEAKVDEPS